MEVEDEGWCGSYGLPNGRHQEEIGAYGLPYKETGAYGLPCNEAEAYGLLCKETGAYGLPCNEAGAYGLPCTGCLLIAQGWVLTDCPASSVWDLQIAQDGDTKP